MDFFSNSPCPDLESIPEPRDGVDYAVPHFPLPVASAKQPKSLATSEGNHCHSSCKQNGQGTGGRGRVKHKWWEEMWKWQSVSLFSGLSIVNDFSFERRFV